MTAIKANTNEEGILARTWMFKLAGLGLLVYATPCVSVPLHGLVGVLPILALALLIGLCEDEFWLTVRKFLDGLWQNPLLLFLAVWYYAGIAFNVFIRAGANNDWRYMMGPVVLLFGFAFAFAFMWDRACYRSFQVWFTLGAGIQGLVSLRMLIRDPGLARSAMTQVEVNGAWIYGNQGYYALMIMVMPVLIWRSLQERGLLRAILLASCLLSSGAALITTFATPMGLAIFDVLTIIVFRFAFPKGGMSLWFLMALGVGIVGMAGFYGYGIARENPLFSPAISRIANVIADPTSGGYEGHDLEGSRWDKAVISTAVFLKHPLWGGGGGSMVNNPNLGGHSTFFDCLGAYGLLGGGGAYCAIVLLALWLGVKRLRDGRRWEAVVIVSALCSLIAGGIVNPYCGPGELFLVILLCRLFVRPTFVPKEPGARPAVEGPRRSTRRRVSSHRQSASAPQIPVMKWTLNHSNSGSGCGQGAAH